MIATSTQIVQSAKILIKNFSREQENKASEITMCHMSRFIYLFI